MKDISLFIPSRLVYQNGPEAAKEAPKELTADQAQDQINAAKGDLIELDATTRENMIKKRNTSEFKRWIKEISNGRERIAYAKQTHFKSLLPLLPKAERDIVEQTPLVLSRANWNKSLDSAIGVSNKLFVYNKVKENQGKGGDYAYISNLDRVVALTRGKEPLEAANYIRAYYNVRYHLGKLQNDGTLNQTEIDRYLPMVDRNPRGLIERINSDVQKRDQKKAEKDLDKSLS
jgi:hypothetical protein